MNILHDLLQIDIDLCWQLILDAIIKLRDLNSVVIFSEVHVLEDLSLDAVNRSQHSYNLLIVIAVCVLKLAHLKIPCQFMCHGVIFVGLDFIFEVEGSNHCWPG